MASVTVRHIEHFDFMPLAELSLPAVHVLINNELKIEKKPARDPIVNARVYICVLFLVTSMGLFRV